MAGSLDDELEEFQLALEDANEVSKKVEAKCGISASTLSVMAYLEEHGKQPRRAIARGIHMNNLNVGEILKHLRKIGVVKSDDAGHELTPAGAQALAEARAKF